MAAATDTVTLVWMPAGDKTKVTAMLGEDAVPLDSINPASAPSRRRFIRDMVGKLDEVEAELVDIAARAEQEGAAPEGGEEGGAADILKRMPEEARAEAAALLNDPLLIQGVVDDVAALGVAGEKELTATVYLTGVSRLLGRPLAAIVQGPSS